VTYSEIGYTS